MDAIQLPITALYTGLFGLIIVAMSIRVVVIRGQTKISYMEGSNDTLARAMRVHGKCVEYVSIALILMGLVELNGAPVWAIHTVGVVLLLAWAAHAHVLYTGTGAFATRVIGTSGSWFVIGAAAIWAINQYLAAVSA